MFASADAQNSVYDTSPIAVVLSEAFDVSSDEELLPPQAPNASNATSGKRRLIVLRMESNRWLVTFIPAKLVDSQRVSKSGLDDYLGVYLENRFRLVVHGAQPSQQAIITPIYRYRIHCGSVIYPGFS